MAETSYPFSAANGSGGTAMVSQTQWQKMGHLWGGDRVDFRLTATTYSSTALPFAVRVVNARDIEVKPGRAWVGGFFYELDAAKTVPVDPNLTDKARIDTVVLRADVPKGSVNLAVVKGQPSASPIAPQPQRNLGQQWEMVLYEVSVPANNGAISAASRLTFDMPPAVSTPWNTRDSASYVERGSFLYDMDTNGGDTQYEAFVGRDGYVITRHFGKSRTYTPSLVQSTSQPGSRSGRWRWIAPNMVWFTATFSTTTTSEIKTSGNNWQLGFTLPTPANGGSAQILSGVLQNPDVRSNLPNFIDIKTVLPQGNSSSNAYLYFPNSSNLKQGLDGLRVFPGKSKLMVSGVYETDVFSEH
ncbi:hypothetical protein OH797_31855 [Streptomyces anulatus]|uniref:hypothetical protein n=1 Tax=Streptomyces anulatus TaxID=1892 RepID=UPI00386AA5D9